MRLPEDQFASRGLSLTYNIVESAGIGHAHGNPVPGCTSATLDKPRGRTSVPREETFSNTPVPCHPSTFSESQFPHLEKKKGNSILKRTGPSGWADQTELCLRPGGNPDIHKCIEQIQRKQTDSKNYFSPGRVSLVYDLASAVQKHCLRRWNCSVSTLQCGRH